MINHQYINKDLNVLLSFPNHVIPLTFILGSKPDKIMNIEALQKVRHSYIKRITADYLIKPNISD